MNFKPFRTKMEDAGLGDAAIRSFELNFVKLASGESTEISESSIRPAGELPSLATLPEADSSGAGGLLEKTVFIKLNGGLGTGMGLEKAKSLLEVKDGFTFLDFIARQILYLRDLGAAPRLLLMNSFSTSADTRAALRRYPSLGDPDALEFVQNRVPKIAADSLLPAEGADPELGWCPPGHGDLYVALAESGQLDALLGEGIEFAFVSNADNLGATLDSRLLAHFASSGRPFMMEVTRRTLSDRKGGHLCVDARTGGLLLRESAQCPEADLDAFQDIGKHQFFNTNNLWIHLPALRAALDEQGGILPLPVIKNEKTLDPRDPASPKVVQLETAMGAAIGCFENAGAVEVPRSRFAPVKTTADLLSLRSDAYELTEAFTIQLAEERDGTPPTITLDGDHYKLVDGLEALVKGGVPSLIGCRSLDIAGSWRFEGTAIIRGDVAFKNDRVETAAIAPGEYRDDTVTA